MIDLQYLSILLGALSFWVAAAYYVLNLREISRNRRITLTTTVLEPFMTKDGYGDLLDLLAMEWTDFEDFKTKYDHRADPENARMRIAVWNRFETIGMLCKEGLLDVNTLYNVVGGVLQVIWFKFKPIIEMYRETEYDKEAYSHFEYLAERVYSFTQSRDSTGGLVHRTIDKPEIST
jgi:hypothetical protein